MSRRSEELHLQPTRMGDVSRRDPTTGDDVFEVLLGEEFLMSSLFTVAEIALAGSAWERYRATTSTSPSAASG